MNIELTPEQKLMQSIFGNQIRKSVEHTLEFIRKIEGSYGIYHPSVNHKVVKRHRERVNRRTLAEKYHFKTQNKN